ncbi:phage tail terminator family protein [Sporosarcina sp. FSL K6-5500]|uniref:phage tail terminator family protein n=1 Tax=Sporosarcina sp. FSL K6-5500 TaxID=2921558 RepID=UPI0030F9D84F
MITYKDLRIAVNRKLKTTGIEVNSEDVSEGFNRPSFFVEFLNIARSSDENQVHKSLSVQIYYFPTDRYKYAIEVLEMQETLENMFDLKLAIKDRLINVEDINTGTVDGVLNCSFDLAFYDGRERNKYEQYPSELMHELDFEKVEE